MMSLLTADYSHCALLLIDFQNDFILPGSPAEIAGSYAILPKLQQLVQAVRSQGALLFMWCAATCPTAPMWTSAAGS